MRFARKTELIIKNIICLAFEANIFLPNTNFLSSKNEIMLAVIKAMIQLGATATPIKTFNICFNANRTKSETVAIRV